MKKANILLCITGSISAYKTADITHILTAKRGHNVTCVMTEAATKFITPLTLQTLSKNKVYTDMWDESDPTKVTHIDLANNADLIVIVPATANTIAKLANGITDNLLTSTILAAKNKKKIVCPAMNTMMYENYPTHRNLTTLKCDYGYDIIEPREAKLACGIVGKGALETVSTIVETIDRAVKLS